METNVLADACHVTLSFIVDTDYILKNFPDAELNWKGPVRIDSRFLSMISDIKAVASGYNTREIKIRANTGDKISFSAEPKSYISKDFIQIYKIVPWIGRLELLGNNVMPDKEYGMQDSNEPETRSFIANVKRKGLEQLEIRFAFYTLSDDGITYNLHGNFYCDLLSLDLV